MDKTPLKPQPQTAWEQQEFEQLLRLSKLTMAQKLQWLEDAHRRVRNMRDGKKEGGKRG
jgi:hypothetical protein